MLKRPERKQIQIVVTNAATGQPVPDAKMIFLGIRAGKTMATTDATGTAMVDLPDAPQIVGIRADQFSIDFQSLDTIDPLLKFELEPTTKAVRSERLDWFQRDQADYQKAMEELLGDLTAPLPNESTFRRQNLFFGALARTDSRQFLNTLLNEEAKYEHRQYFLLFANDAILAADPRVATQLAMQQTESSAQRARLYAHIALQIAGPEFREELLGEAVLATQALGGAEHWSTVGFVAQHLISAGEPDSAIDFVQSAWNRRSTTSLNSFRKSFTKRDRELVGRNFGPALAIVDHQAAFALIEKTTSGLDAEFLIDEALTLVSLCDWSEFVRLSENKGGKREYLTTRIADQLELLSNQRLAEFRPWLIRMTERVEKPELQMQLWLFVARGETDNDRRRMAIAKAIEQLKKVPRHNSDRFYSDPGRVFLKNMISIPDIDKDLVDGLAFALMNRAPESYDEHTNLFVLCNLIRVLAIGDAELARKIIEPALRHHDWLFDGLNRDANRGNIVLHTALWIDPEWAVEETRRLSSELSSDDSAAPLELRSGVIENAATLSDALKKNQRKDK
jgi:hypothetical protein